MRKRHKKKLVKEGRCPACKRFGWIELGGKKYCWRCKKVRGDV